MTTPNTIVAINADGTPIGAGGGGGSGGPATVVDGGDVTQGAKADAAVVNPALSASQIALLKGILTQLQAAVPAGANAIGSVIVSTMAALAAGSAIIGKVGIDHTTPGTTDLVTLGANQSVNHTQIAGIAVAAGNGATTTGTQRVTISSDSTGVVQLAAGAAVIGALTADQTVNQTKLAGTAVDTNSGNKSAGTQRMVIATDQPNLTTPLNVTAVVTSIPALVAGAAIIGKFGVDQTTPGTTNKVSIGTDGTVAVIPGVAATSLGKAEDAGHTSGDTGVMMLAVRNDAGTVLAGTDLDYIPLTTDSTGALRILGGGGGGGTQYTEDVASAGAELLTLAGAVRQDTIASSTSTDGDYATLKVDNVGRMYVNANLTLLAGTAPATSNGVVGAGVQRVTIASDSTGQIALAAGAAVIGSLAANQSINNAQINGVAPLMGNGISGTGAQRMTLASDSTGQVTLAAGAATIGALTANQSVNAAQINGVAPLMGNGVSGTGAMRVTIASDSTGQIALAAGTAIIGSLAPNTSGGPTLLRIKTTASTNAALVKGSPGQLYGYSFYNLSAALKYVRFYNLTTNPPVPASSTVFFDVPLPPNGGRIEMFDLGIPFTVGMGICVTGGLGDTDNTSTAADDVHGFILFK